MNNNKIPFCKVCFDSGKPDTKHWVKDRSGKVCCPTLLALKCRLCDQCGHTVKYCSKAQPTAKAQPTIAQPKLVETTMKAQPTAKAEPKNMFDLLYDNSDDDSDEEDEPEAEKQAVKKPEAEKQTSPAVIKRWIDYDSDSDDEPEAEPEAEPNIAFQLPNPLLRPNLKRYGHSDSSNDSFAEAEASM